MTGHHAEHVPETMILGAGPLCEQAATRLSRVTITAPTCAASHLLRSAMTLATWSHVSDHVGLGTPLLLSAGTARAAVRDVEAPGAQVISVTERPDALRVPGSGISCR